MAGDGDVAEVCFSGEPSVADDVLRISDGEFVYRIADPKAGSLIIWSFRWGGFFHSSFRGSSVNEGFTEDYTSIDTIDWIYTLLVR